MMRRPIFLLHVLFVSSLFSSIFGMPLDKRTGDAHTSSAHAGSVQELKGKKLIGCFYNMDGSEGLHELEYTGSETVHKEYPDLESEREALAKRRQWKGNLIITKQIEKILKELGAETVTYKNFWTPLNVPGDLPAEPGDYPPMRRAFMRISEGDGPECPGEDAFFAWFVFIKDPIEYGKVVAYGEVVRKPKENEKPNNDGFVQVAATKCEGEKEEDEFYKSKAIWIKYFAPAQDIVLRHIRKEGGHPHGEKSPKRKKVERSTH